MLWRCVGRMQHKLVGLEFYINIEGYRASPKSLLMNLPEMNIVPTSRQ